MFFNWLNWIVRNWKSLIERCVYVSVSMSKAACRSRLVARDDSCKACVVGFDAYLLFIFDYFCVCGCMWAYVFSIAANSAFSALNAALRIVLWGPRWTYYPFFWTNLVLSLMYVRIYVFFHVFYLPSFLVFTSDLYQFELILITVCCGLRFGLFVLLGGMWEYFFSSTFVYVLVVGFIGFKNCHTYILWYFVIFL